MDQKLSIYLSNTDKFKNESLFETIVYAAKRYQMAGATVLKGTMGYGKSSGISSLRFWELTEKVPIVIEIIDESEKINSFIEIITPYFDKIKSGCLITIEEVHIVLSKKGRKN